MAAPAKRPHATLLPRWDPALDADAQAMNDAWRHFLETLDRVWAERKTADAAATPEHVARSRRLEERELAVCRREREVTAREQDVAALLARIRTAVTAPP